MMFKYVARVKESEWGGQFLSALFLCCSQCDSVDAGGVLLLLGVYHHHIGGIDRD